VLTTEPQTRTYIFRPDVVATVLNDGAVLLDLDTKYFYRLNRTGWMIAQLFEAGTNASAAWQRCLGWGACETDKAAVEALCETLIRERLVEEAPEGDGADAAAGADEVSNGAAWTSPTIERQAEPLQKVIISAFDPSVPLVE
jgi:hypothetical protein